MLVFAASRRLIASMTPVLDLLVNLVCFHVYSRTAGKTGSPGRSSFCNCLSVSFLRNLYRNLGRPTGRLPPVNFIYIISLGRRSMGIRCTWPRKAVNGHTVYVTKEGGQWAYGVRDQGRRSIGVRCTWPSQRSRLYFRMLVSGVELQRCRFSRFSISRQG